MATDEADIIVDGEKQVNIFADKFSEWYGIGHVILARHAAFPISITSDLLYQLWANFKNYTDSRGQVRTIPMLAVSDLLLSSLFRQTGRDIYEMLPSVRACLLDQLKKDEQFGEQRIKKLASFLYQYVQQLPDRPEWKNFKEAQKWTAMLATDPELATRQLLQSLIDHVADSQVNASIGVTNMIEAFVKDNEASMKQLASRLQPVVSNDDIPGLPAAPSAKRLVLTDKPIQGRPTFNLPPYISNRLQGIRPVITTMRERLEKEKTTGKVYGLLIGVNEYPKANFRFKAADKDAIRFSQCLKEYKLINGDYVNLLLNEAGTRERVRSSLEGVLSMAMFNDTVLIYFAGHAINKTGRSFLAMYDYINESAGEGAITDLEFSGWIRSYGRNNPNIILVLDTHSGSTKWLDEYNPRHISLMGCHLEEVLYEEPDTGGYFTNALVQSIEVAKGVITYRELYKEVHKNIQQRTSGNNLIQNPLFIVGNSENWDRYIFTDKSINKILQLQSLLSDCGYPVAKDGIDGPQTRAAKQEFLKEHNISDENKISHYLELKKSVRLHNMIQIMIISEDEADSTASIFHGGDFSVVHQPFRRFFNRYAANAVLENQNASVGLESRAGIELASVDAILIVYKPSSYARVQREMQIFFDITFAFDKEVVSASKSSYKSLEVPPVPVIWRDIDIDQVAEFRDFLRGFLSVHRTPEDVPESPYSAAIKEAVHTGKLDLSNHKLTHIPEEVFELTSLKELYLEGNHISEIPAAISSLSQLQVLNLNSNPISVLPAGLLQLHDLELLALDNTSLKILPDDIGRLQALRELRLHGTSLIMLPDALAKLSHLEVLDARESHILNVPTRVIYHKNAPQRFRDYLAGLQQQTRRPLLLLLAKTPADTKTIAARATKNLGSDSSQWIRENEVDDPASLYAILKKGTADHCLIYINDKNGELFRKFEFPGPSDSLNNMAQFITAIGISSANLFYDGFLLHDDLCKEIVKLVGINSIVAQTSKNEIKPFKAAFFKYFLAGNSIGNSFSSAEAEFWSKYTKDEFSYKFYKAEHFVDFSLPSSGGPIEKKPVSKATSAAVNKEVTRKPVSKTTTVKAKEAAPAAKAKQASSTVKAKGPTASAKAKRPARKK